MDRELLQTFLTVSRTHNLSDAASQLSLSQPGVSRRLQRLESDLGVQLFDRTGASLRLTPAGERFAQYAEDALTRYDAILDDVQSVDADLRGPLRIAASSTPGELLVPGLVAAFTTLHPGVEPHVFITDSAVVESELLGGRWDIGFTGAKSREDRLRYRPILDDEVVLAVPASHPFASRKIVSVDELEDMRFIDREAGSGTAATVTDILGSIGISLPPHQTAMTLGTTQAIVSAVESGLGIGWVSSLALEGRSPERVVAVRLEQTRIVRKLWLVDAPRRTHAAIVSTFLDFAVDHAQRDESGH